MTTLDSLFAGKGANGTTAAQSKSVPWGDLMAQGQAINATMPSFATTTLMEAGTVIVRVEEAAIIDGMQLPDGTFAPNQVKVKVLIIADVSKVTRMDRVFTQSFYLRKKADGSVNEFALTTLNGLLLTAMAGSNNITVQEVVESLKAKDPAEATMSHLLAWAVGGHAAVEMRVRQNNERGPSNELGTQTAIPVSAEMLEDLMNRIDATSKA